jgi:hypothetical protein
MTAQPPQTVDDTEALVEMPDDLVAFNREAMRRGWGDGFPLIPPTEARVARILAGAEWRDPSEVIGLVAPRYADASVKRIAINAAMAGCEPEYLPVLLAAVQAMCSPAVNLHGAQVTTHNCAVMTMVNGPIAKRIGIASKAGLFGPGHHANVSIGRALRLILQNIGGAYPGTTDRSTHGSPAKLSFCFAENEEDSPWDAYHVSAGFEASESTVTAIASEAPHNINDHVSREPLGVLFTIAQSIATMGSNNAYMFDSEYFIGLGPEHAAIIASAGWSRADVQRYLFERARIPFAEWKLGGMAGMLNHPRYLDAADDGFLVPISGFESDVKIAVLGGPGKHSCWIPSAGLSRSATVRVDESGVSWK